MKIKIRSRKELKENILKTAIEEKFSSSVYYKFSYVEDNIGKRTFNAYAFDKWIEEHDIFSCCMLAQCDKEELRHYKALYKSLLPSKEHPGNVALDVLGWMEIYGKILKFIKPILAERLEDYINRTGFLEKCTWLEEFKSEFEPYISLFKNPIPC